VDIGDTLIYSFDTQFGNDYRSFSLDPNTGKVTNLYPLDADGAFRTFQMKVIVTDNYDESSYDEATLSIEVLDINDNAPKLLQKDLTAKIKESLAVGAMVQQFDSSDADFLSKNRVVRYALTDDSDCPGDYLINMRTGVVRVAQELDYEERTSCQLGVRVYNFPEMVGMEQFGTLVITVEDVNDNFPTFDQVRLAVSVSPPPFPPFPLCPLPLPSFSTVPSPPARKIYSLTLLGFSLRAE